MHASRQDVEVLFPLAGLVRPVFDTQIAAALTGLPAQIGYGELVRRTLGTELAEGMAEAEARAATLNGARAAAAPPSAPRRRPR